MTEPSTPGGRRPRLSDEELANAIPSRTGGREVWVGIFVIFGIISFIVVLFLLTDPATMRGRYMLVTTVEDAGGVRRGDPVQMRGVIIGRVNGFEMLPSGRVAIRMELEGEWNIPVGSRSQLGGAGLFGGRTLEVVPSDATTYHEPFDTIPGGDGGDGLLGSAEELSEQAGSVLAGIEALLDDSTVSAVQGSASELEVLLADLSSVIREQRGTLRALTESLTRSAEGLEDANPSRAIARADSAMAVLAATGENLDRATSSLRSLLERIERGEGTLGRLAQDEALYDNLNRAAESLVAFLDDIQTNPNKYINVSIF